MRPRLESIQALRGAACLLVVAYHAAQFEASFGLGFNPLGPARWFAYAGVDLFFVISGFVMAFAHRADFGRAAAVPRFLARRAWRIFPVYWVVLALTGLMYAALYAHYPPAPGTAADVLSALALLPGPVDRQPWVQPWVPQAWSLAFELAFYLAFAALLPLPRRWAAVGFAGWFAAVVGLAAAGVDGAVGRFRPLWAFPLVAEFLVGVLVGWVAAARPLRPRTAVRVAAAWAAAGVALTFSRNPDVAAVAWATRALVYAVPCGLVVYAAAARDLAGGLPPRRWLVVVGEASYPIYLIHLTTQILVFHAWNQLGFSHRRVPHVLWAAATVGAAVGAGWGLHRLVERPLLNLAKRRPTPVAAAAPDVVQSPVRKAA